MSRTKSDRYKASVRKDRYAWRDEMPQRCMNCLKRFGGLRWPEIHEILTRGRAPNNWAFCANYLLLCNPCHAEVGTWQDAEQLALKKRRDPAHYDLQLWLATRNPAAMQYVTEAEIEELIRKAA